MSRLGDVRELYQFIARLERQMGGARRLCECNGRMSWPSRGVYFFFDPAEPRTDSGMGARIVRVGTHALTTTSRTTLWKRLAQHRGSSAHARGNHRGSIFRALVGEALIHRDGLNVPSWGRGSTASAGAAHFGVGRERVLAEELGVEQATSQLIGNLPCVVMPAEELTARGSIERNAIAMLSNFNQPPLDPPSALWLGLHSQRPRVRGSGLWNNYHVDEPYDPDFIDYLVDAARSTRSVAE